MSPSPTWFSAFQADRRYKKLLPALLYDAAVPSSCVALKSHVQTPPRRRGRHRAEERRVSRGRGPRTDAHVVVMVGGRRHHFCTYVHTMDKHRGQKAGYIFISSTHSSLEVSASVGSLARSPSNSSRDSGCPTFHALFRSGITERPPNEASEHRGTLS